MHMAHAHADEILGASQSGLGRCKKAYAKEGLVMMGRYCINIRRIRIGIYRLFARLRVRNEIIRLSIE
jgi:hypothetical protein